MQGLDAQGDARSQNEQASVFAAMLWAVTSTSLPRNPC